MQQSALSRGAARRPAAAAAAGAGRQRQRLLRPLPPTVTAAAAGGGVPAQQLAEQQQQLEQRQQRQQWPPQQPPGRRQLLGAALAAAAATAAAAAGLASPRPAAAAAAAVEASSSRALEEYMKLEDDNRLRDQRAYDNIRGKYGIRRSLDGRVSLRRKNGTWMSVRLDMEVPGAILLRDTKSGAVYALETDSLPQVDLSDDYVLFMMFADGQWESDMTAVEFEDEAAGGKAAQLTMTEKEFHEFVGLLKEPEDEPAAAGRK